MMVPPTKSAISRSWRCERTPASTDLLFPTSNDPTASLDLVAKHKGHRNSHTSQILGDLGEPVQMTVE